MIKRFETADLIIFKRVYGKLRCETVSVTADGKSVNLSCESRGGFSSRSFGPMSISTLAERVLRGDIVHVPMRLSDLESAVNQRYTQGLSWKQFVALNVQTALRRAARLENRRRVERVLSTDGVLVRGFHLAAFHTANPHSVVQPRETPAEVWRNACAGKEEGGE